MHAISLWQPWASLWISGHKVHETRHWQPPKRILAAEHLAVHAAKRLVRDVDPAVDQLCKRVFGAKWRAELPRGALIGSLRLVRAICMTQRFIDSLTETERACGNFQPGRVAWEGFMPMEWEPIPFTGRQGFFTVPPEIAAAAALKRRAA